MKTVILAGGRGTRLAEETSVRPKPMVEIGERPLLWHIMQIYSYYGFEEFLIALGYKGEIIKEYFLNFFALNGSLTINLATGEHTVNKPNSPNWRVHLIETGMDTMTGGRIKRVEEWLSGETFMATYGDGLADIDVTELVAFHRSHGRLATVMAVRPPARFGGLEIDVAGRVVRFVEKPQVGEGWINGGFFVLEPGVFDYIGGDETVWERQPLERLAAAGELRAFRHHGFFQPMDTLREKLHLEELWRSGKAPWRIWDQ